MGGGQGRTRPGSVRGTRSRGQVATADYAIPPRELAAETPCQRAVYPTAIRFSHSSSQGEVIPKAWLGTASFSAWTFAQEDVIEEEIPSIDRSCRL